MKELDELYRSNRIEIASDGTIERQAIERIMTHLKRYTASIKGRLDILGVEYNDDNYEQLLENAVKSYVKLYTLELTKARFIKAYQTNSWTELVHGYCCGNEKVLPTFLFKISK